MEDLEIEVRNNIFKKLKFKIHVYYRFVDDIYTIVPTEHIQEIKSIFNDYDHHLQFTTEIEKDNKLSFLETLLIKNNKNHIITNWYRKPTYTGCYINYFSHHPLNQKIGIIYMLVDRAIKLAHKNFHNENLDFVKNILVKNDYPTKIIEKYIKKRISIINNCDKKSCDIDNRFTIVLPYSKNLYFPIYNTLKPYNIQLVSSIKNKLQFVKLGKDAIKKEDTQNVVYEISCLDCNSKYIGQTKRKLKIRVNEHKRDIKSDDPKSEIARHAKTGHKVNWKKPKIVDIESNYRSRLFSEMSYIHLNKDTINNMKDTERLQYEYKGTLNLIAHV